MSEYFKPCPFCGSNYVTAEVSSKRVIIKCNECFASVKVPVSARYNTCYKAQDNWNTRAHKETQETQETQETS